ncbi:hypothetical protein HPB49_021015 [Dermacentor silvarum]|uniref:Uncharacterized protein n=1 Tax=Dermacentor silvarum TaxID=543639 RepID=A0ACB8E322_DERSI|nr:hypothetical protein HPB49_021015 [Dermacentor silvarum]
MQHLKVILRPREGLVFSKWQTPVIARAVLTPEGYPRTTPTQNLIVRIESKQNIAVVSTSSEDMVARIRDINTVHLGAKEYAVATYIAPPANSARGVAHGIPQGTTDAELMRGLYAHKRHILQARMLGPCATALITFEGRTVPRSKTLSHVTSKEQQALAALVQELRVEIAELRAQLKEERSRNKPPAQESSPEPRTPPQPPQRASTASVVQETVEEMNTEAPPEPNPTAQPIDARVTACEKGIHENRKAIQELHMRMEKGFDEIRQMIKHLHEVFTPLALNVLCIQLMLEYCNPSYRGVSWGFLGTTDETLFILGNFSALMMNGLLFLCCVLSGATALALSKSLLDVMGNLAHFLICIGSSLVLLSSGVNHQPSSRYKEYIFQGKVTVSVLGIVNSLLYLCSVLAAYWTCKASRY